MTLYSTALGHHMPLLGGTSEQDMSGCNLPPQLKIAHDMYIDWSFCALCCCYCLILLLLFICHCASTITVEQQQNYT